MYECVIHVYNIIINKYRVIIQRNHCLNLETLSFLHWVTWSQSNCVTFILLMVTVNRSFLLSLVKITLNLSHFSSACDRQSHQFPSNFQSQCHCDQKDNVTNPVQSSCMMHYNLLVIFTRNAGVENTCDQTTSKTIGLYEDLENEAEEAASSGGRGRCEWHLGLPTVTQTVRSAWFNAQHPLVGCNTLTRSRLPRERYPGKR